MTLAQGLQLMSSLKKPCFNLWTSKIDSIWHV
jgi:hypothetical protein